MADNFGIVCFGRGIEKRWRSDLAGMYWWPTAYLEKTNPVGQHSGLFTPELKLDSDDESVLIAGGHVNAMATATMFVEGAVSGKLPRLLSWAAGRPKYLEGESPDLSEGSVFFTTFKDQLSFWGWNNILDGVKIEFQTQNKNTRDDLLQSLDMAKQMGLSKLIIISVLVHLRRIHEFYKFALRVQPDFADIKVEFKASELAFLNVQNVGGNLLLDDKEAVGFFNNVTLANIIESPVYRRTAAREQKGIEDLRAGRYNFGDRSVVTSGIDPVKYDF